MPDKFSVDGPINIGLTTFLMRGAEIADDHNYFVIIARSDMPIIGVERGTKVLVRKVSPDTLPAVAAGSVVVINLAPKNSYPDYTCRMLAKYEELQSRVAHPDDVSVVHQVPNETILGYVVGYAQG